MIAFHINRSSSAKCRECDEPFEGRAVGHITDQKISHLFHEKCVPARCFCGYEFPSPSRLMRIAASSIAGLSVAELCNYFGIEIEPTLAKTALILVTTSLTAMGSSLRFHARKLPFPNQWEFGGTVLIIYAVSAADAFLPVDNSMARTAATASLFAGIIGGALAPLKKTLKTANSLLDAAVNLSGSLAAFYTLKQIKNLPAVLLGAGAGAAHSLLHIIREKLDLNGLQEIPNI